MTVEDTHNKKSKPTPLTNREGTTIDTLLSCMKDASTHFKRACNQSNLQHPLNENKLTQILVEQIEVQIKPIAGVGIKNQYSDIFFGTKGIPDFYFHKVEEGVTHYPLFVVEAKILPAPTENRKQEYVIGNKNNGGIERFKTEKHGKGLNKCGMIGFVENNTFEYWQQTINTWIKELSDNNNFWKNDETLVKNENTSDFMALQSIAHRISGTNVSLYHLWIYTK
ncbi:MAG: hypothetical protein LBV75_03250 [Paludibacter sp.]|jgi:hypothetical protein|nr:hypothetical protein [Paludibacter sp.]